MLIADFRVIDRLLVSLLLAALCAPVLAAPARVVREEVQVAVWYDQDRSELDPVGPVARAIQARNPGMVVTLRPYPSASAYRQLQQWSQAGALHVPDVILIPDLWLPRFAQLFQPVNALIPAHAMRAFPESVKSRLRFGDRLYGMPWNCSSRALYYRPELLQQAGVIAPRTWEDVVIAARRCHRPPDVYGFGLPGIHDDAGAKLFVQMLWSYGGDVPPVGDPSALGADALTRALSLSRDLHSVAEPEVLSWDQSALEDFFVDGRLSMLIADREFAARLAKQAPDLNWRVTALPRGPCPSGFISLDIACLAKSAERRDIAVKFLTTLATSEVCELLLAVGGVPVHEDVIEKHRLDEDYSAYVAAIRYGQGLPPERWSSAQSVFTDALFYLLTGRKTLEDVSALVRQRFESGESVTPEQ